MQTAIAPRPISVPIMAGVLRLVDLLVILCSGAAAYSIWLVEAPAVAWPQYAIVAAFGALIAINLFHLNNAYEFEILSQLGSSLRHTLTAWTAAAAILLALSFVTKTTEDYSRAWSILWFALAFVALGVTRLLIYNRIRRWAEEGRLYRNVVIVGAGAIGQRLLGYLAASPDAGVRILGVFDDQLKQDAESLRAHCAGYPVLGDLESLVEYVRNHPIDTVIVALPWSAERRLLGIFAKLRSLPVDVRLCPDAVGFHLKRPSVSYFGQITMFNVMDKPLADWPLLVKEAEDRVLAAAILVVIAPVMLIVATAIKLDSPGPVFFRQKRFGFNNQLIEVLKFRTMHHDQCDEHAERLATRNDPRVTRLGAFLRRTSLDELPQFMNVLRGQMSIVGPRPHALSAKAAGVPYQDAVREYASRHRVKPGITGWAQINGWRGETETLEQIRKRVEHDLYYIENWSLRLDLKIIALTVLAAVSGRHAY